MNRLELAQISSQIYEDLKRDHKVAIAANKVLRREVDDLWKQIHDLKHDLLAAKRIAEVDDSIHRRAVAERIGFAMPADPAFVPGWQTIYDAVASAWSSLCCARQEAIPKLERERDSLRARAESCHDALIAAKRGRDEARAEGKKDALADAVATLASHLAPLVFALLRDGLLDLVPEQVTRAEFLAALDDPSALAALLLRVRGPVGVER